MTGDYFFFFTEVGRRSYTHRGLRRLLQAHTQGGLVSPRQLQIFLHEDKVHEADLTLMPRFREALLTVLAWPSPGSYTARAQGLAWGADDSARSRKAYVDAALAHVEAVL